MKGVSYIWIGIGLLVLASVGFVVLQMMLTNKKKNIREKIYQSYN